jgi:hypothetical protein
VVVVGLLIFSNSNRVNWNVELKPKGADPYDLSLFYRLLETSTDQDVTYLTKEFKLDSADQFNFVFVGEYFYDDSTNTDLLLQFIEDGSTALFISNDIYNNTLFEAIWARDSIDLYNGESMFLSEVYIHLRDSSRTYPVQIQQGKKYVGNDWFFYYPLDFEYEHNIEFLSYISSDSSELQYVNYISIPYGKGKILYHLNPILFSNYFLAKEQGFEYASYALSQLPQQQTIVDFYSQTYRGEQEYFEREPATSPLSFIFSEPALRSAWIALMVTTFLFFLVRTKRRQRIIPLIAKSSNTSIEFARSLGSLYFQSKQPKYIGHEMMKIFTDYCRRTYRVSIKNETEEKQLLAKRAKVDITLIHEIFKKQHTVLYNPQATFHDAAELHNKLQDFYKNAKK